MVFDFEYDIVATTRLSVPSGDSHDIPLRSIEPGFHQTADARRSLALLAIVGECSVRHSKR